MPWAMFYSSFQVLWKKLRPFGSQSLACMLKLASEMFWALPFILGLTLPNKVLEQSSFEPFWGHSGHSVHLGGMFCKGRNVFSLPSPPLTSPFCRVLGGLIRDLRHILILFPLDQLFFCSTLWPTYGLHLLSFDF